MKKFWTEHWTMVAFSLVTWALVIALHFDPPPRMRDDDKIFIEVLLVVCWLAGLLLRWHVRREEEKESVTIAAQMVKLEMDKEHWAELSKEPDPPAPVPPANPFEREFS